jgi:DNA polymerase-1
MKQNYQMTTDLKTLAAYLGAARTIAIDLETAPREAFRGDKNAALDPHKAEIVGISVAVAGDTGCYVPLRHHHAANASVREVLTFLKDRVFENPEVLKIVHNLDFEARFLLSAGLTLKPPVFDTLAGAQLILKDDDHFRRLEDCGLKTLARDWAKRELPSYEQTVGAGDFGELDPASSQTIHYACADADLALQLYSLETDWFKEQLPAHGALLQGVESPVALFAARMAHRGVFIDQPALADAETRLKKRLGELKRRLEQGETRAVKIGENAATNDFKRYLFEEWRLPVLKTTATGRPSVDGEALDLTIAYCESHYPKALSYLYDVAAYRGLAKLIKTYLSGLGDKINPVTGAIHTRFFPLGTETGRFASRNPNCQNLPGGESHGIKIRDLLIPRPGHTLVALDYSQIELRIGAWYTGDAAMVRVFAEGGDIHGVTTAAVYGISLEEALDKSHPAYKQRRTVAKNINFGIFYGLYPRGLKGLLKQKAGIDKTLGECEEMIASIHRAYPGLAPWQSQVIREATLKKTVATALGRRRCLPGIADADPTICSHYQRAALNHPIQGTAADILKLAMVRLLPGLDDRPYLHPLLTVHDEILFEVETPYLSDAIPWLKEVMEAPPFPGFDIKLVAEVSTGLAYGSLDPWTDGA